MLKVTPRELREYKIFSDKYTYALLNRAADTIEKLEADLHEALFKEEGCGWCNKYDEVLCDDWGNCFKYCPICGRNLGNGV